MATDSSGMPPSLLAALERPVTERRAWQDDLAPAYISVFLLVAYYDQLAKQTLSVGGLGWSLLGAWLAGLLCYGLLYYVPAMWGLKTRQPLAVVATSTFGAAGSPWVPGLVLALAQVVWLAVAIFYATDMSIRALAAVRLLDPSFVDQTESLAGLKVRGPLFLFVTLAWGLSSALIGTWLLRLVAAVMKAYAVFPALVLGAAMLWALPGLGGYRPLGIDPVTAEPVKGGGLFACLMMIQLIFGFFATSGASAADWGSYSRGARDVRLGGLVGVALAALILAVIPLLIVAGALGRAPAAPTLESALAMQNRLTDDGLLRIDPSRLAEVSREVRSLGARNFTLRVVIEHGIGGLAACVMLFALGLTMLGPSCYAPFIASHRFAAIWPRLPRWAWALATALAAWPIAALAVPARAEFVFGSLGAAMAPVVGAMSAEYVRCRGTWAGPRRGVNMAGLIAWATGFAVGLIPILGAATGLRGLERFQPASVSALGVAFLVYACLARLGLEPDALALPAKAPEEDVAGRAAEQKG